MIEEKTVQDFALFCASLVPPPLRQKRMQDAPNELEMLCKHLDVTEIAVAADAVYVGTRILIANDNIHALGEFMLTISTRGAKWENLTSALKNNWQAPYVSGNLVLCGQSSHTSEIQMLIKDGAVAKAFLKMIESAKLTPGDFPEALVSHWPQGSTQLLKERAAEKQIILPTQKKGLLSWMR